MYYVARVEVVKAIRHVPQLRGLTLERDGYSRKGSTRQVDAVCPRILCHVFSNPTIIHPIADDLEWRYLGGDSEEGNDVRMV